jgi:hypothetical protein
MMIYYKFKHKCFTIVLFMHFLAILGWYDLYVFKRTLFHSHLNSSSKARILRYLSKIYYRHTQLYLWYST